MELSLSTSMAMQKCVKKALLAIDNDTKREYEQALREVPYLVKSETRPWEFFLAEDFDVSKATLRLCRYWKARRQVFGDDRWLLPLNQTGFGALSEKDIAILRSGCCIFFPPSSATFTPVSANQEQQQQPPGLVIDDVTRAPFLDRISVLRMQFYFAYVYRGSAMSCINRAHIIASGERPKLTDLATADLEKTDVEIQQTCLPIKVKTETLFIIQALESLERQELLSFLAFSTQRMVQFRNPGKQVPCIRGQSVAHLRSLLIGNGINLDIMPPCVGGNFNYLQYDEWTRQRLTMEGSMSAAPLHLNRPSNNVPTSTATSVNNSNRPIKVVATTTTAAAAAAAVHRRKPKEATTTTTTRPRNSVGKSTPPTRRAISPQTPTFSVDELKARVTTLNRLNQNLRKDNYQLEQSLARARLLVTARSENAPDGEIKPGL